jgi:hypothetical protein
VAKVELNVGELGSTKLKFSLDELEASQVGLNAFQSDWSILKVANVSSKWYSWVWLQL